MTEHYETLIWAATVVILVLAFFLIFREPLSKKIQDLRGVKTPKGSFDFSQNQETPPAIDPAGGSLLKGTEEISLIEEKTKALKNDLEALKKRSNFNEVDFLLYELAKNNFREEFIFIYAQIYGTQLEALLAAEKGGTDLAPFFSQHKERTEGIETYKPSEETWKYFLIRHNLIEERKNKVFLTEYGKLFLKHIKGLNLPLTKSA